MRVQPVGSNRILVVEPDATTRELLADVLRTAGCEAVPVDTGERALTRARAERGEEVGRRQQTAHALRLDAGREEGARHAVDGEVFERAGLFAEVDLPGLVDGWIVADEFRSANPSSPIVLASDEPSAEVAAEGTSAAVVRRPTARVDVLAVVKGLIRRCQIGISVPSLREPPYLPA